MSENIVAKVHKLLRLSTSNNEHEAAMAAAKAQELIDQHNLTETMLQMEGAAEVPDEPIMDFSGKEPLDATSPNKLIRWKTSLASHVCRWNGCQHWRPASRNQIGGGVLHIVGRPSDVETVRYLYGYLSHEVERLTDLNGRGCGRTWKNNYRLGVVDAIANKLYQQHKTFVDARRGEVINNSQALVRVDQALAKIQKKGEHVKEFMKSTMGIKFSISSLSQGRHIKGAREQGREDGRNIALNSAKAGLAGQKGLPQ